MARKTDDAKITEMYTSGTRTTVIAEYFGVSTSAIRQRLRKLGISNGEKRREPVYSVNTEFFLTWSPEMAYVLGFILTDGSVSKDALSISQKDKAPLAYIQRVMNATQPIKKRGNLHTLIISRKSIVEDLNAFGISQNKSLTVELPYIDDEVFPDFLRGVIDGDGYVHPKGYVVTITSGSENFAKQLTYKLNEIGFDFKCGHDGSAWRVKLSGKEKVEQLGAYIYANPNAFGIDYKKERMLEV